MKINGVVFDLDHTLFDRYATLSAIASDFCTYFQDKLAGGMNENAVAQLLCEGDRTYIYYGWKRVFEFLLEKGMFTIHPEYSEYKALLLKLFTTKAVPFSFTYKVLEEVKARGLKTGLITNGDAAVQREKLKLLGLTNSFDEVILCGDFGIQKPDAAPFKEMARRLGCSEGTLIYVGDNPICDVGGASGAGYITVEVLTADCTPPNAPVGDYRIKTVAELAELLDKLIT